MTSYDDSTADVDSLQDLASSSVTGIRPVTVHQLLDATRPYSDAKFSINDIIIDRISIIAQVVDVQEHPSSIVYVLSDGTRGCISARQWRSDDGEPLSEGHSGYAHVIGHLDTKARPGSKNTLIVKSIRALHDPADQLFFHIMQAAFVTLCFERGPPPSADLVRATPNYSSSEFTVPPPPPHVVPVTPSRPAITSPPQTAHSPESPTSPSLNPQQFRLEPTSQIPRSVAPSQPAEVSRRKDPEALADVPSRTVSPIPIRPSTPVSRCASPQTPRRDMAAQGQPGQSHRKSRIKRDPYAHLSVLQRAILLQILNTQHAETGSNVFTISRGVAHHNPSAEQIGDALDFLVAEGHVETTMDTGHYAIRTSHYPASP